jgi:hypothetical protein
MKIGDMVRWARFKNDEDVYKDLNIPPERKNDLGLIIDIDVWDYMDTEPETIIIEVFFFKVGIVWCNPSSLEVVSNIKDVD